MPVLDRPLHHPRTTILGLLGFALGMAVGYGLLTAELAMWVGSAIGGLGVCMRDRPLRRCRYRL